MSNTAAARRFLDDVQREFEWAQENYAPFNSAHEAYAITLEEFDELWDLIKIKQSHHDNAAMRDEAVQAAAMLARFVVDVLDKE